MQFLNGFLAGIAKKVLVYNGVIGLHIQPLSSVLHVFWGENLKISWHCDPLIFQ